MKEEDKYKDMKYILTSKMRTKLIISLYEKSKNLEDLRKELDKPSATILHGLKELEELTYIKKLNKYYSLTSNGYILAVSIVKLVENWYAIDINKIFWNTHSLESIPEKSIKNLYQLKNAECIKSSNRDLSKAYSTYVDLISSCENLKIILPIFSEKHLQKLIELIEIESLKKLEILTTVKVMKSIKLNARFKKAIKDHHNIKISTIPEPLDIYLTVSEEFMCLTLFFNDGHYDDSQLLVDKTKNGIEWGCNLYNHYENNIMELK